MAAIDQHYENELFICSSKTEDLFAQQLHSKLLSNNVRAFYGPQSILWGDEMLPEIAKAVVKSHHILVIVSKSLLDSHGKLERVVVNAFLKRQFESQDSGLILPALLDIDQVYFDSNFSFLSHYESVKASRDDPEGLAQLVVERLRRGNLIKGKAISKHSFAGLPVPIRDEHKGRVDKEEKLLLAIKRPGLHLCCIHGPPGVGKSRLATEVAHKARDDGFTVVYVKVERLVKDQLLSNQILAELEVVLGSEQLMSQKLYGSQIPIDRVRTAVSKVSNLCLILDGCDAARETQPDAFGAFLQQILSGARSDFTLITTCCKKFDLHFSIKFIGLTVLSSDSSLSLLEACYGSKLAPPIATEYVRLCGGIPIALQAVGRALKHCRDTMQPKEFLHFIKSGVGYIQRIDSVVAQFSCTPLVSTCLRALFILLQERLRKDFLCLAVFPGLFTVQEAAHILEREKADFKSGVLFPLKEYGFIRHDGSNKYSLHNLIRDFAHQEIRASSSERYKLVEKRYCEMQLQTLDTAWNCFYRDSQRSLQVLDKHLVNIEYLLQLTIPESHGLYERFMTVGMEYEPMLAGRISALLRKKFYKECFRMAQRRKDVYCEARMTLRLAGLCLEAYEPHKAQELINEISERTLHENELLGHYWLMKAVALVALNDRRSAIAILEKQLQTSLSFQIAVQMWMALGDAYFGERQYDTAAAKYRKARSIVQQKAKVHPVACTAAVQIGQCYYYMEDYEKSRDHFLTALGMQVNMGCDRLSLAAILYHIGIAQALVAEATAVEEALHDLYNVDEALQSCDTHHLKVLVPQAIGKLLLIVGVRYYDEGDENASRETLQQSQTYFKRVLQEHTKVQPMMGSVSIVAETEAHLAILHVALARDRSLPNTHLLKCQRLFERELLEKPVLPVFETVLSEKFDHEDPLRLFSQFLSSTSLHFVGYYSDVLERIPSGVQSLSDDEDEQNSSGGSEPEGNDDDYDDIILARSRGRVRRMSSSVDPRGDFETPESCSTSRRPPSGAIQNEIVTHTQSSYVRDQSIDKALERLLPFGPVSDPLRPPMISGELISDFDSRTADDSQAALVTCEDLAGYLRQGSNREPVPISLPDLTDSMDTA